MPDNNAIRQELRENNPFMSAASPQPWNSNIPDLMQLNKDVSEKIEQLILHKRRLPSTPFAGLILGEPGSGKTHMLTRILRSLRKHDKYSIFVTVKTFLNPDSVISDLLSEILTSLKQYHSSETKSQFDMLVNEIFESYKERMENEGFSSSSINSVDTVKKYLAQAMHGIDKNVLKCLMLYRTTSDKDVKYQILDWLNFDLDDEESHELGLPFRDPDSMTDAKRENEAAKILKSLGFLLEYAHVPMIICFDQLDDMRKKDLISAWGSVISMLVNDLSGVLPLCFVKYSIWSTILRPVLDPSVVQRLDNNTMIMKECSLTQAKSLIHDRIAEAFENNNPEEKYNWLIARLKDILKQGLSPRMVIELANKEILKDDKDDDVKNVKGGTTPPNPDGKKEKEEQEIFRTIQNVYNEECRKIKSQPLSWPPNTEQLSIALEAWLNVHEGFEVTRYSGKKHLKIHGSYHGQDFFIYIVMPKVAYSAINALKQGTTLMNNSPDNHCFYISESKIHKKSYRKTNEILDDFKDLGGHSYILDEDSRVKWYGLFALVSRIDNGDVDLLLDSGNRTATRDDIKGFVSTLELIDIDIDSVKKDSVPAVKNKSKAPVHLPVTPDTLGNALLDIAKESPMTMLSFAKAVEYLSYDKHINISETQLEAFLKANANIFKIFKSQNNELLMGLVDKS